MANPTANSMAIELDEVMVRHQAGPHLALDRVSLRIEPGERVAVIGPSGAGKSTLLSVLNTSMQPTAGTVHLLGADPSSLSAADRRRLRGRIGTVYQDLHLPGSLRVIHNVNAGRLGEWSTRTALASLLRPRDTQRAQAALDTLGIGDKLWQRTDELSGGERQRVGLARLIVQRAELILADEPTASLDPARAGEVCRLLAGMVDGSTPRRTLVVGIHAVDLAIEHFDRVIGLRQGRIIFDRAAHQVTTADCNGLYELHCAP